MSVNIYTAECHLLDKHEDIGCTYFLVKLQALVLSSPSPLGTRCLKGLVSGGGSLKLSATFGCSSSIHHSFSIKYTIMCMHLYTSIDNIPLSIVIIQ